jgi:nucleoside 2-deoxyribosyltransferase
MLPKALIFRLARDVDREQLRASLEKKGFQQHASRKNACHAHPMCYVARRFVRRSDAHLQTLTEIHPRSI